jgi:hypothetical protein
MSASNHLAGELLKAERVSSETETDRQLQKVREFIGGEQAKVRKMKWLWIAIAAVVQVLLWVTIIWFPAEKSHPDQLTDSSIVVLLAESLLPVLIVSGCVALLLLHMWRTSRREAQQRLEAIEQKLASLSARD